MATALMINTNLRRENTWINFVPKRAPMPAPMGMHPVRIPFAMSGLNVIVKMVISYLNSTVLK